MIALVALIRDRDERGAAKSRVVCYNLRATGGDPLAFNRRDDEAVTVRKSTSAERKAENFRRVGRKHLAVE